MRGSSPRVWGQVSLSLSAINPFGIIPTRMGTSFGKSASYGGTVDHPHAYGDKHHAQRLFYTVRGSSPRVWGQVLTDCTVLKTLRIIPTRMGTSPCEFHGRNTFRDHPHAYGDKKSLDLNIYNTRGSSPRVWGQECR